ncbi:MAG: hypothetical protein ABR886_02795 [Dehalococcoidales bacterium]|jgi:hypothetical protein
MKWEIGAIPATITVILVVILQIIIPALQKSKRKKPLLRISELKDKAIELQNTNKNKLMTVDEMAIFKGEVESIKQQLLSEIAKISKPLARQYHNFGAVDVSMFSFLARNGAQGDQITYLGVLKRCWELADKIAEKYS